MPRYEVVYYEGTGRADIQRLLLDFADADYKNVFLDITKWAEHKDGMTFGKVPQLRIYEDDGSRKELVECSAIEAYLAEVLGLMPGTSPFARAEVLSVMSALTELEEKVQSDAPTVEERKAAHEKFWADTIPGFLKYQERFVRGPFYFGDKVTAADVKLYQMYVKFDEMYGTQSPFKTLELPNLQRIIATLDKGKAGDYARNRRMIGVFGWLKEEWRWGLKV